MPKGVPNESRVSWMNSYQKPRAAALERLDEVSSGDRGAITGKDNASTCSIAHRSR